MKSVFQYRTFFRSKSVIIVSSALIALICVNCTSDPEKRPSPLRSDSTSIGGVGAYIEFSSPGVKDRKIFGEGDDFLVPYDELWRTGANHATFIEIAGDMKIDSFLLEAGKYSIFTIPNRYEWTLIFNKEWDQWGSYQYKDSLDAIRMKITPRYANQSQERMLFYFADDSLKFRWDKVRWSVPITNHP
ncbi:Protein of unknown function [Ekhidna lutea]|uniref:DUF2911 domain-containing protein n=1 Tax=Ekhidna lutea TaxID=447679 RepID=A0A239LJM6_EKHLU|nr:DUF2911 domain-containing protein [Ekhidna lutea]SNT30500.1 Protein of unknown function [Ekhidna lutea]